MRVVVVDPGSASTDQVSPDGVSVASVANVITALVASSVSSVCQEDRLVDICTW